MASLSLTTLATNSPITPLLPSFSAAPPTYTLGFHIPPLTSVQHLHLHAFELPFDDFRNRVEFRSTVRSHGQLGKKAGWFVGVGQVSRVSVDRGPEWSVRTLTFCWDR